MDGKLKKIDGVFIVGTTKSIFMDGTGKTLQEAIDNGELGGGSSTATTSGRGYVNIKLRGATVYVWDVPTSASAISKIKYSFPTGDTNRERRLFVWTPSGAGKSIDIPDGELNINEALVYNFDTNKLETRTGTWGNVACANNEIILLYNDRGFSTRVGGVLSPYIKLLGYEEFIPFKNLEFEVCSNSGNNLSQGMFIINNNMYLFGHSSDDKTTTLGDFRKISMDNLNTVVTSGNHNLGHMNAPSYSHEKDMMIVGNGSKIYDQSELPMEGYIFYNFESKIVDATNLDFDSLDKTIIDLSMFVGEFKAQLCWECGDNVILLTSESRIIRRLKLGKGTEQLTNGTYTETTDDRYNGTFEILSEHRTPHTAIMGGMKFHNGYLYVGAKGNYPIRRFQLCTNGGLKIDDICVNDCHGTMQGIDIKDGILYAYTNERGYKINLIDTII